MKNLLIFALFVWSLSANAQLIETSASKALDEVTTIGSFSTTMQASQAKLTSTGNGSDKTYTLKYRQNGSKPEQSVVFKGTEATLTSLYDIFKTFFTKENIANENYTRTFTLGDKQLVCKTYKNVTPAVQVKTEDGMFFISESQVGKLFGKK
jgi:hypothetical protein